MLASLRLTLVLGSLALVAGCSTRRPPAPRAPSSAAETSTRGVGEATAPAAHGEVEDHAAFPIPKVVKRILAEQKDLLARSQAMANELPDPRGRARAIAEVNELAQELTRIAAPVTSAAGHDLLVSSQMGASGEDSGPTIDSDLLDEVVTGLLLLDTRVSLLHEKLRTATERTTAVLLE